MTIPKLVLSLVAGVSLAAVVSTQTSRQSTVRKGELFEISLAGPAVIRQQVLPTNLGRMLAGGESLKVWTGMFRTMEEVWEANEEGEDRRFADFKKRLLDYAGRMVLRVRIIPGEKRWLYDGWGYLLFRKDGRTDMKALAADLQHFLESLAGERAEEATIGDLTCKVMGRLNDDGTTMPILQPNGDLLMLFGPKLGLAVRDGMADLAKRPAAPKQDAKKQWLAPFLTARVDLEQVVTLIHHENQNDNFKKQIDEVLGLSTWREARVEARATGPFLVTETSVTFGDGDRGIFGVFLPEITKRPDLVDAVPEKANIWAASHVRYDRFYNVFMRLFASFGFARNATTLEEYKAEVNKELGFDMEKDFLAHMGTETLVLGSLHKKPDEQSHRREDPEGVCFAVRIKNDEAFAKHFEKMAAKEGGFRTGETEDYKDVSIVQTRLFSREGEYHVMLPGMFVYGIGDAGLEVLKSIVDHHTAKPETKLPAQLRTRLRQAPPGLNGIAMLQAKSVLSAQMQPILWEVWRGIRHELPSALRKEIGEDYMSPIQNLVPMLEKYQLDRIAVFLGWDKNTSRLRIVW